MHPKANLVIRPEKLGDLIVATPVFRLLKEAYPEQPLHLLTDNSFASVVQHDPYLDRIIGIPWKSRNRRDRPSWWSICRTLSQHGPYERAAILFANVEGWNWAMAFNRINKVAQLGGTFSALALNHHAVLRKNHAGNEHMSQLFHKVAVSLGCSTRDYLPELYVTDPERESISRRFPFLLDPFKIFIHAFSVSSPANFAPTAYCALAAYLAKSSNSRVYLLGTAKELATSGLRSHPLISTELVGNLNLRELMAACTFSNLVIGGSSGIVHMAAALDIPTLGLYCPAGNHHLVWGPRGHRTTTLCTPVNLCRRIAATSGPCSAPRFCDISFGISNENIWNEAKQLITAPTG